LAECGIEKVTNRLDMAVLQLPKGFQSNSKNFDFHFMTTPLDPYLKDSQSKPVLFQPLPEYAIAFYKEVDAATKIGNIRGICDKYRPAFTGASISSDYGEIGNGMAITKKTFNRCLLYRKSQAKRKKDCAWHLPGFKLDEDHTLLKDMPRQSHLNHFQRPYVKAPMLQYFSFGHPALLTCARKGIQRLNKMARSLHHPARYCRNSSGAN
jgi:hypothetical protein